ncbi:hypothetical protein [Microbacterium invictum]|uniref:Uncharacterized protein n=1 Tax=Microbacterium invictum TaxID=515415 RepID=A0AA40SMB8_9MICO|nr:MULTISPECIES: hypothetical protein [Microbacterium]MBB4138735.1 hypothetical protein [Microbacterium invictum]
MTSSDGPKPQHTDLDALREEIDELKSIPEEELVNPTPADLIDREPTPEPTDSIGSEDWNSAE